MKIFFLLVLPLAAASNLSTAPARTCLGIRGGADAKFQGDVECRWLIHGRHDRDMRLLKPFSFVDENGRKWTAPKDFDVDGASIPRPLWATFGSPYVGRYRRASVVHDFYCKPEQRHLATSGEVHQMFYEAMLCDKVNPGKAWLMYQGVRIGGPRWP